MMKAVSRILHIRNVHEGSLFGNLKLKWDSHIVQMLEYKDESRLNDIVDILNELYVSMEAFDTAGFSNCD